MVRISDRYIARQLVSPFVAWLSGLLVMLSGSFLFALLKQAGARELPLRDVLVFLGAKLPWGLVMSIPMAYAFAACLTVNRMARENEITALRIGGMSPRRMSVPVIAFGGFLSLWALGINEYLVPWATDLGREAARSLFFMSTQATPQANVFVQGPGGYVFSARTIDTKGEVLSGIQIVEQGPGSSRTLSTCERGSLSGDIVRLTNVNVHVFNERGQLASLDVEAVREIDIGALLRDLYEVRKPLDEMSAADLMARARKLSASGLDAHVEIHKLHMKLAVPLATVAFALVGVPLILRISGSGFTGAMMAIGIVFAYYTITAWGMILADGEHVNPVLGAWACNGVFALVGSVMLWRAA